MVTKNFQNLSQILTLGLSIGARLVFFVLAFNNSERKKKKKKKKKNFDCQG